MFTQFISSVHQFTGDEDRLGVLVGSLEGKHMPDGDQELPGDGNDGFVATEAWLEAGELSLPVGMGVGGSVSGFDQSGAQVFAPGFGDAPGAGGETGVVHPGAQTGVTGEVFGIWEARDVADGSQDGHGGNHADAWELDEDGQAVILSGDGKQAVFEVVCLLLGEGESFQVGEQAHLFEGRDRQGQPPIALISVEEVAMGRQEVMAVQESVEAVLSLCGEAGHLGALSDENAQIADLLRRDPDAHEQAFGEQASEVGSSDLVGHDLGTSDQGNVGRMDDSHGVDVGQQLIINLPGVGGHFDHHGIAWREGLLDPGFEVGELDALGTKQRVEIGIHAEGDQVVFVDVETDETDGDW